MKSVISNHLYVAVIASISLLVVPCAVMFVTNSNELNIPLFDLSVFLLKVGVVFFVVTFAMIILAGKTKHLLVINSLFFLVLVSTIQFFLLSDSLNVLDGQSPYLFSTTQIAVDLIIYGFIGGLIFAFRHKVYENIKLLFAGICLFQLINLGVLILSRGDNFDDIPVNLEALISSRNEASDEGPDVNNEVGAISSFSRKENVLHIVLDGFQSGLFQDVIRNDNEIASALDGFLYYPDTLTASEVTQLSFAAFLTGQEYTNNEPMKTYLFNSRVARMGTATPVKYVPNILEAATRNGFTVDVATPFIVIKDQEFYSHFFFIPKPYSSEISVREVVAYQAAYLFDLTLFRSAPKLLKKSIYNQGRWRYSGLYARDLGLTFNHHIGVQFLKEVIEKFRFAEQTKVYKLFHLVTPHPPFVTDSNCRSSEKELKSEYTHIYNQARCTLVQVVKLLDKFKRSGIYDTATILVHGDHGIGLPFQDFKPGPDDDVRNFPKYIGKSNPLLLFKPPGGWGKLVTVDAEVSLADIPRTISGLLQLGVDFDGVDFLNEKPVNRVRRYYHTKQSRVEAGHDDRFLQWGEYEVSGPLTKKSSWKKTGESNWTKKNFTQFPVAQFLEINEFGLADEKKVWIRYRNRERHHIIAVGDGKRITRFVGEDTITAVLRSRQDFTRVCIVDTVRELRQCLH